MELQAAILGYLKAGEASGKSPRTLSFHRQNLLRWLAWLKAAHITGSAWCQAGVADEFLAAERARGMAPSTIQARYRSLRAFGAWLVRREMVQTAPYAGLSAPVAQQVRQQGIPHADYIHIMSRIDSASWRSERDRLVMSCLYESGLRVGELAGLKLADIDVPNRLFQVERSKSRAPRAVPFSPDMARGLAIYLMSRPAAGQSLIIRAHRPHDQITEAGIRHIVRTLCHQAGTQAWSPHAFRRGYAQRMLDGGLSMELVSELLGHASVDVTRAAYADWRATDLRAAYDRAMSPEYTRDYR